jgi:CBS domain-containing protein
MDIADIAVRDTVEVAVDERLAQVRSLFERENPKGVLVTADGAYEGVITERQLLSSHMEDDTKASAVSKNAPRIDRTADVREVARVLVEGGVKVAPVFEAEALAEALWGIITEDAILEAVLENLGVLQVAQIMTEDVVTLGTDATVGRAINQLREHGISRLPVVTPEGGVASTGW